MGRQLDKVEHEGKIVDISEQYIRVEIVNKSACAACHAKGVCAASDEKIKFIEVPLSLDTLADDYKVGDVVNVVMKGSLGLKAIWFAYVVPLIVLMASILVFSLLHFHEAAVGLLSVGVVALYYIGLFFFRNKLSKIFTFYIQPIK